MAETEVLVHAFVTSQLDYCNVLVSGPSVSGVKKPQLVQNDAAKILTKMRKLIVSHLVFARLTGSLSTTGQILKG